MDRLFESITSYDSELAKQLIKEWEAWVKGNGKVSPPDWPSWSGKAQVILSAVANYKEGK